MDVGKVLFRPVFEQRGENQNRNADQRDDAAAIKTYRYLRLGMIVIVVALFASILFVHRTKGCWQGSISAYYYTPSRPIFVSGMIAIAVSLIVIKGSTFLEDLFLNIAGMLAPIVALVPTTYEKACVPGQPLEHTPGGLTDAIIRDAQNNIAALLIAGGFAFLLGVAVLVIEQRGGHLSDSDVAGRVALLFGTAAALLIGSWLLATDRILDYHGWSALVMFGFLGLASIVDGVWLWWVNRDPKQRTSQHWQAFSALYLLVGAAMAIAGVIIKYVVPKPWDHRTLILEITEIALFVAMWAVQSVERWGRILQTPRPTGQTGQQGADT